MFNDENQPFSLKNQDVPEKLRRPVILWEHMEEAELLAYFTELREHLPSMEMAGMNVEEELMLQYRTLKAAQREAMDDPKAKTTEKASISNAVSTTLARIAALQNEVYTSERFKNIETALIRLLKTWPEPQVRQFLEDYKKILGE